MSQTERLIYITQCLNNHGCIDKDRVCREFEVDPRTVNRVNRDIEYLRDRCDCSIEFDRKTGTYISKKPVNIFSPARQLLLYSYITGMAKSLSLLPFVTKDITAMLGRILDSGHLSLSNAIGSADFMELWLEKIREMNKKFCEKQENLQRVILCHGVMIKYGYE